MLQPLLFAKHLPVGDLHRQMKQVVAFFVDKNVRDCSLVAVIVMERLEVALLD